MKIPGYVDLQVNGFIGIDFSSENLLEEDFVKASLALLSRGTAAFLPTVITSEESLYKRNLPLIARCMKRPEFKGKLLGIHVEGPFVSKEPGAVGAHNPAWTRLPDISFFNQMQEWADGQIKLITIAAELPGAAELTKHAVKNNVTVSLGHQLAKAADLARCADAGAKLLTHLGNGVPNMLARHPNPIWDGIAEDRLTAMIITDSHHLPASVIKTIIRAKGADRTIITSDASPLAGLAPGKYRASGNDVVIEESGLLHNPVKQCLVGSSATMQKCMKFLSSLQILSEKELQKVGFYNPLAVIGVKPEAIEI